MTDNATIVEDFIAAWNRLDWDGIFAAMHPEIRYHNIPWAPVEGIAAVRENLLGFNMQAADFIVHAIAVNGAQVLTERTDRIRLAGNWVSIRVMGIFEIEDGLIRGWRDYFDPAELGAPAA